MADSEMTSRRCSVLDCHDAKDAYTTAKYVQGLANDDGVRVERVRNIHRLLEDCSTPPNGWRGRQTPDIGFASHENAGVGFA